jgi:pyruvate formate lyase activating enzyme
MSGREISAPEIMEIIEKERVFFDQSGGGVTFSGGEPLLHSGILIELLDELGRKGIHRAIDTAGHVKTEILVEVARRTDLFLYDLKVMDTGLHEKYTGVGNEKILRNLEVLADSGAHIIIRIPVLGGINDDEVNIRKTAMFINSLSGENKEVHLLPYHKIAQTKYSKLGKPKDFELFSEPDHETLEEIIEIFRDYGINASIGG